jgi:nucleotide-binding universal stress UspA family protein
MDRSWSSDTSESVVVVGVDDSAGARAALRWAVTEARLRKTRLRVVHAWTFSYPGAAGYGYLGGTLDEFPDGGLSNLHGAAEDMIDHAIAGLAAEAESVEIEREIVEGRAAEVLVGAATERDLLVVGSRGHGGFAGLLLGSVSQQCAHHARCPVVIVHAPMRAAGAPGPAEGESVSSQAAA